ncbi:MAG: FAD-dependent oxidoreductase, partial [Bdellovibrionota bacterium]
MIHTWRTLLGMADSVGRLEVETDVCVIGSGAGGSAAAYRLAKKGKKVTLLETGSFLLPRDFNQREEAMFSRLFYDSGGRRTADFGVRILHGHGVGGSTLHNINLCKRIPDEIVEEWDLPGLSVRELAPFYAEVEDLLRVTDVDQSQMNTANRLFQAGVEKLGYRGGMLRHNRVGCVGSGFCELGCAFDAKMNAAKILIPEFVNAGGQVFANTRVIDLERSGRKIVRARARLVAPDQISRFLGPEVVISAKSFVLACGAIETPALIRRSGLPDRGGLVGTRLYLHPGAAVAGKFSEPVESWKGVPQSYECTEFLDFSHQSAGARRIWIFGGSAHPAGAASFVPGIGEAHAEAMSRYPNLLPLSIMLHDESTGHVQPRAELGVRVDYALNSRDRELMAQGIRETCKILLAAGAT